MRVAERQKRIDRGIKATAIIRDSKQTALRQAGDGRVESERTSSTSLLISPFGRGCVKTKLDL